jgi:hypothetical protein
MSTIKQTPFAVGDKVVIVASSQFANQPAENNAEPVGEVKELLEGGLIAVEFPKISGSGSFREAYAIHDLEKAGLRVSKTTIQKDKPQPKKISLSIRRKDGMTIFKFAIDPRITEIYRRMSESIRRSEHWIDVSGEGLEFFYLPSLLSSEKYKDYLSRFNLIDDFGAALYKDGKLNIAWLRTTTGKGEITVKEQVAFAEMSILVKQTIEFLKQYFEEYYRDYTVNGSITVEV